MKDSSQTEQVNVRMTRELLRRVEAYAASRSEPGLVVRPATAVRMLVEQALALQESCEKASARR